MTDKKLTPEQIAFHNYLSRLRILQKENDELRQKVAELQGELNHYRDLAKYQQRLKGDE